MKVYRFVVIAFVFLALVSVCRGEDIVHEVKPGETISDIAWFYKVKRIDLLRANPWLNPDTRIKPGHKIQITLPDKGLDSQKVVNQIRKEGKALENKMASKIEESQGVFKKYLNYILIFGIAFLLLICFIVGIGVKKSKRVVQTIVTVNKKSVKFSLHDQEYKFIPDIDPDTGEYISLYQAKNGHFAKFSDPTDLVSSIKPILRSYLKNDEAKFKELVFKGKLVPLEKKTEAA